MRRSLGGFCVAFTCVLTIFLTATLLSLRLQVLLTGVSISFCVCVCVDIFTTDSMESRIPRVTGTRRTGGDTQVSHVPAQLSQSHQFTEGMVREILTSSPWFREMIEQAARGLFEPKVKEIHTEILNLKADLSALRTDVEPLCSNSWQQEIYRLDRDIDALRDFVKRSSEAISQEMAQVVGKSSEDALNPRVKREDVVEKIRTKTVGERGGLGPLPKRRENLAGRSPVGGSLAVGGTATHPKTNRNRSPAGRAMRSRIPTPKTSA